MSGNIPRTKLGRPSLEALEVRLAPALYAVGPYTVSVDRPSVVEGQTAEFNVAVGLPSTFTGAKPTITLGYAAADGTATRANSDFFETTGSLTFPPASLGVGQPGPAQKVRVGTLQDTRNEADETFSLQLDLSANGLKVGSVKAPATIRNDDPVPEVSLAGNVSHPEGNAGQTDFTFTARLGAVSGQVVKVDAMLVMPPPPATSATDTSTAIEPDDAVFAPVTLVFQPGQTERTFTVKVNGDRKIEPNETFTVLLKNAVNARVSATKGTATGTITDDDRPIIRVNNVQVTEGNAGTTNAVFTVSLSTPATTQVRVNWVTADATAVTNLDFVKNGGLLIFAPGETTKTVTVQVKGDLLDEGDEYFYVVLLYPTSNASVAPLAGRGTIRDDDFKLGSISGQVFYDLNKSSSKDGNEPGLAGRTVFLDANRNGALDFSETSTRTDAFGNYRFAGLRPGFYVVGQILPQGWQGGVIGGPLVTLHSGEQAIRNLATYQPGNIPPIARNDAATTTMNHPITVTVLGNDTDGDGDVLSVASFQARGSKGTITRSPSDPNKLVYTPDKDAVGDDSFIYNARDPRNNQSTATVRVTIVKPNLAPKAQADVATVLSGQSVTVAVLANDSDPDGDKLSVTSFQATTAKGTITRSPGDPNKLVYAAKADAVGDDTFTYTINDGKGHPVTATVKVTIVKPNLAPKAQADAATVVAGQSVTVAVLANDSDPDGDKLTVTSFQATTPKGTVTRDATDPNKLVYAASIGATGQDTFSYTIDDGKGHPVTGTVVITLTPPPHQGTIYWKGASGDWDNPANWSTGAVPGPNDDVVIDVPGVTVIVTSGDHSVRSLFSSGNLTLVGPATLSLSGGQSEVTGALLIAGANARGSLTVSGEGTTLEVKGAATLGGAQVQALAGAVVRFGAVSIIADPTGIALTAKGGGAIEATGLTDLGGGATIEVDGPDSRIDLPALTQLAGDVSVSDHGTLRLGTVGSVATTFIAGTVTLGDNVSLTGGDLTLASGTTLSATGPAQMRGGLTNNGTVQISGAAQLWVAGNYSQSAGGHLAVQLAQLDGHPLDVDGDASLAGALDLTLVPDLEPGPGASIPVIRYHAATGTFASVTPTFVAAW